MQTITAKQIEALENSIYSTLMASPYVDSDGEVMERGMGEMGEARDEAARIVHEWMEESGITEEAEEGWKLSDKYSIFYKIEGSGLLGCAQMADGSRENDPFEVDFYAFQQEEEQSQFKAEMVRIFGEIALTLDPIKFFN